MTLDAFYKMLRHLKATISNTFPEVVVLAGFVVFERNVADNSEGNERCLVDVADLCDGTTFHVNGCCFWEVVHYLLHFLT